MQQQLRGGKEKEGSAGRERKRGLMEGRQFLEPRPAPPRSSKLGPEYSPKYRWTGGGTKTEVGHLRGSIMLSQGLIVGRLIFVLLKNLHAKKTDSSIIIMLCMPYLSILKHQGWSLKTVHSRSSMRSKSVDQYSCYSSFLDNETNVAMVTSTKRHIFLSLPSQRSLFSLEHVCR